ncbi:MAG: nicotinate-nucleotide adenylyltransferase [Rubrivivax sp.]
MTGLRRVGLFGGTFDPVHEAHVALAHAALAHFELDHLRWIPSGRSWQKVQGSGTPITPAADREAMVRLAIEGEPRFVLDRIELERPGPSYTLDTVRQLHVNEPDVEWVLILGQDQYAGLHTWHDWSELLGLVTLAVANRPGPVREPAAEVQAHDHQAVPLPMLDISSTAIRAAVAAGRDISQLVPLAVARYIDSHHLYRS